MQIYQLAAAAKIQLSADELISLRFSPGRLRAVAAIELASVGKLAGPPGWAPHFRPTTRRLLMEGRGERMINAARLVGLCQRSVCSRPKALNLGSEGIKVARKLRIWQAKSLPVRSGRPAERENARAHELGGGGGAARVGFASASSTGRLHVHVIQLTS